MELKVHKYGEGRWILRDASKAPHYTFEGEWGLYKDDLLMAVDDIAEGRTQAMIIIAVEGSTVLGRTIAKYEEGTEFTRVATYR